MDYAKATGALINEAFYTWVPHLQLCICYDIVGNHAQAYYHNEMASLFVAEHSGVLSNRQYFESVLTKKEMEEIKERVRI